jgi:hypothetical protein
VYVVPNDPLAEVTRHLTLTLRKGNAELVVKPPAVDDGETDAWPPEPWRAQKGPLLQGEVGAQGVSLTYGAAPQVAGTVRGFDREMEGALAALGYVDDGAHAASENGKADEVAPTVASEGSPCRAQLE